MPKGKPFVLPVSLATQRVVFYDTVRVPGRSAERLKQDFYNGFSRNFTFADFNYTATGPTTSLQPREPATPGETVILGTISMFKPGEQTVFVAGITPPEALDNQPPFSYLHFTLRARFEPEVAYLIVTDLHQRTTTMKQEMVRRMALMRRSTTPDPQADQTPPSTPIETLYAAWLPGYMQVPGAHTAAATKTKSTTQAEAQRMAEHAHKVLKGLHYIMTK